jgi:hypothetical protein
MVIASTMFEHKNIHKITWGSPDGQYFNQLEYIPTDSRHISNLMAVRTFRGANIDSAYFLAVSQI